MLWSDFKMCVTLGRFDLLSRSPSMRSKYEQYKDALHQNNIAIEDVIVKKMRGAPVKWMRNAFPYDVDGTRHYVIWSATPLKIEEIREIASFRTGALEFVAFVNPSEYRSIKRLWHAHVLVKKS